MCDLSEWSRVQTAVYWVGHNARLKCHLDQVQSGRAITAFCSRVENEKISRLYVYAPPYCCEHRRAGPGRRVSTRNVSLLLCLPVPPHHRAFAASWFWIRAAVFLLGFNLCLPLIFFSFISPCFSWQIDAIATSSDAWSGLSGESLRQIIRNNVAMMYISMPNSLNINVCQADQRQVAEVAIVLVIQFMAPTCLVMMLYTSNNYYLRVTKDSKLRQMYVYV